METKYFQFSGFNFSTDKVDMVQQVIKLDGVYFEAERLKSRCTHLIVKYLSRAEKCLSACASGIWILREDYLWDSFEAGRWLKEEDYEWNSLSQPSMYVPHVCQMIGSAPERNRKLVQETGKKRFAGWVYLLKLNDKKKEEVYTRILKCGGATTRESFAGEFTHVFIERGNMDEVRLSLGYYCLFLSTDYLRNFLFMDPVPNALIFQFPGYEPSKDPLLDMFVLESSRTQNDIRRHHFSLPCSPLNHIEEYICSTDSTGTAGSSGRKNKSSPSTSSPKRKRISKKKTPARVTEEQQTPLIQVSEMDSERLAKYLSSKRHITIQNKLATSTTIKELKSMLWDTQYRKRPDRIGHSNENVNSEELPSALASMFDCCMEENSPESALNFLFSVLTTKWFPPHRVLSTLIELILKRIEGATGMESNLFLALSHLQRCHPPVTKPVCKMYLEAFTFVNRKFEPAWTLFSEVIRGCLPQASGDCNSLLSFLIDILEEDFVNFLEKVKNPSKELTDPTHSPLICKVVWPEGQINPLHKNCKELLSFLAQFLKEDNRYVILSQLQQIFSMVAECIRLSTVSAHNQKDESIKSLNCRNLIKEMLNTFSVPFQQPTLVGRFLYSLGPIWIQLLLSEWLICTITIQSLNNETSLSLEKIISDYMLPDISKSQKKRAMEASQLRNDFLFSSECQRSVKVATEMSTVNVQNRKGETPVHKACMHNNIPTLRSLLAVPGVNINVRDNGGWTPLHEACNHGHMDCVKLLLQWIPHPDFMPQGRDKKTCFVDLQAADNFTGSTPLHDAVNNNHLGVAKILLQYGGKSLLTLKNKKNFSPLDLVVTQEMHDLLNSKSVTKKPTPQPSTSQEEDNSEFHEKLFQRAGFPAFTPALCSAFLSYLTCMIATYISWNNLPELIRALELCRTVSSSSELLSDIYTTLFEALPPSESTIQRLRMDLKLVEDLQENYQKVEVHVEKLTGKDKKQFQSELLCLEMALTL